MIPFLLGEHREEDGVRVFTNGFYDYGPAFDALWSALDAAGWSHKDTGGYLDVVEQWRARQGVARISPEHLFEMDRFTLFNTLRWFQRGERFCDGIWAGAWSGGIFHAGARAMVALN